MPLTRTAAVSAPSHGAAAAAAPRPDRPLLTYCDDATGERTELSAGDLGGWAARTASLLRDGCGLRAGDRAAVLLPPHWQTAAVLLGAWSTGVAVSYRPWATAGLGGPEQPVDAVFVTRRRLDSWLETVPEAVHRFVVGQNAGDEVPGGYLDYLSEVRRHSDAPPPYREIRPTAPASTDGMSHQEWSSLARDFAASIDLCAGDRLLVNANEREQPVMWLLAPLSVGASVVLCANLNRATLRERAATEGATHVL